MTALFFDNSVWDASPYSQPEVIKGWAHTSAADWWGLAILLYELTHGRTPFRARWREQTFDFITQRRVEFPKPEAGAGSCYTSTISFFPLLNFIAPA